MLHAAWSYAAAGSWNKRNLHDAWAFALGASAWRLERSAALGLAFGSGEGLNCSAYAAPMIAPMRSKQAVPPRCNRIRTVICGAAVSSSGCAL